MKGGEFFKGKYQGISLDLGIRECLSLDTNLNCSLGDKWKLPNFKMDNMKRK